MGNSLRCCLACVLPCGVLDVIRIVHLNGHVEEITRPISAKEVLLANPNHVLSKPCSQGVVRKILILSPESDLKRGNIYFLIPNSSVPEKKRNINSKKSSSKKQKIVTTTTFPSEIDLPLPKGKCSRRDRKCNRPGVWKPHLQSISEDL